MKVVRGIRNNNPANIRRGSAWKGLVSFLVDPFNNQRFYDKQFCQFEDVVYGVRALLVLLRTYHYKYKLNTISKVIHRFAPLSENNTYAYIANVVLDLNRCFNGVLSSAPVIPFSHRHSFHFNEDFCFCWFINPKEPSLACRYLAKAICKQESGYVLTDDILDKAVKLL